MVKIRLRRLGRKKRPIWAVVAADARAPRDGRFIEDLGRYYPLEEPARIELKDDRVIHWLQVGAQPTDTVRSILSRQGLMLQLHMLRKGQDAEDIKEAVTAHRLRHESQAQAGTKVTAKQRQADALKAEAQKAEKELKARLAQVAKKAAEAAKAVEEKEEEVVD